MPRPAAARRGRGDHGSLCQVDRRDFVLYELVEVPRHALVGETDRARLLQAGDDFVDVGEELEAGLPVDQRHLGTVRKGSRGADPREPAAHDHDSLLLRSPHGVMPAGDPSLTESTSPTALASAKVRLRLVRRSR